MPSIMDRLFGRKPATSTSVGARLDAARTALADSEARQASADERRKSAIIAADRAGAIAAKADGETAEFGADVARTEIAALEAALADLVEREQAEACAARGRALRDRAAALKARFGDEWVDATATIAALLGDAGALARDIAEAGASGDGLVFPTLHRGQPAHESVALVDQALGAGLLSAPLTFAESVFERQVRETREEATRRRAEREAESARKADEKAEVFKAQRLAERQAEDERERSRYYPGSWREHLKSDAAR